MSIRLSKSKIVLWSRAELRELGTSRIYSPRVSILFVKVTQSSVGGVLAWKTTKMQTFLLFLNLWRSFAALDVRRLGKQRVEAFHIWKVITGIEPAGRWRYAPAVRMWYGHDEVLKLYILICCRSWELRGGRNDLMRKYIHQYGINRIDHDRLAKQFPVWLTGYPGRILTESHRSQLCRKNPVTYRRFWPYLGLHKGYWWPVPSVPRSSAIGHDETLARFGQHELNLQNGTRVNLVAGTVQPFCLR